MASNKEELKNELAKLHEEYEAEIPRLTNLAFAVVGALESKHASSQEVATVCLEIMLQAFGHIFGEMQSDILADAISQVLAQLSDDPLAKELFNHVRGEQSAN